MLFIFNFIYINLIYYITLNMYNEKEKKNFNFYYYFILNQCSNFIIYPNKILLKMNNKIFFVTVVLV